MRWRVLETDKVGEHHRDLTPLGAVFGMCAWGNVDVVSASMEGALPLASLRRQRCIQQLDAVPKRRDAKLFQVLVRQARENRLVYVILAECSLILPEAQAPRARPQCP